MPECNPDAFSRWIIHVEASGRQMTPNMRVSQARRLAGNGDFEAQAEVVLFCGENGYKTLIPLADVRARTQGMTRARGRAKSTAPTEAERLQKLKDNRAECVWLKDFRDPNQGETAAQYLAAQEAEYKRWQLEHGRSDARFPELPGAVKDLVAAKRVSA